MQVTRVSMSATDKDKVRALATVTLDEEFVIHDLRVVNGDKGYFVAMPSKKLPSGEFKDIAHPLNSETRTMIQDAVLAEYQAMFSSIPSVEFSDSIINELELALVS